MTFEADIANVAYTLAQTYGKQVQFVVSTVTHDPITGAVTTNTSSTSTVKVTPPAPYKEDLIDGTTVKFGDCSVILPSKNLTFTPSLLMTVTFDSKTWKIVDMKPYYSGTSIAAYELHLRSA